MKLADFYLEIPTYLPTLNFISIFYLVFILGIFILNYLVPKKMRYLIIALANTVFIYSFGLNIFIYTLTYSLLFYLFAFIIKKHKFIYLSIILLVVFNLIFYKYLNFTNLIMPLGLSFYSFKGLSYLFDIHNEKIQIEYNPIIVYNYITFFPAFIAGPIHRYKPFKDDCESLNPYNYKLVKEGFIQLLMGIFEKVVICDFIAIFVEKFYAATSYHIIFAILLYSLNIYLDFDSLSNIAIGSAKIIGYDLKFNFKTPYLATNLKEFWHRWHISLSSFFSDYVYKPLGGSRKGTTRKLINITIVFLLSGIWHGNSINFIIWGMLHAIIYIVEEFTINKLKLNNLLKPFFIILNYLIVSFTWIFFKFSNLNILSELATKLNAPVSNLEININEIYFLICLIFTVIITDILRYRFNLLERFAKINIILRYLVYTILIFIFLIFGTYGSSFDEKVFIYRWF